MNLKREILHQICDPSLSNNERAELRCALAWELEEAGDYEEALEAMAELCGNLGQMPNVEGLEEESKASVLLRAGSLTGWIGGVKQVEGAQEIAKNLICESMRIFAASGQTEKTADAQSNLALCYWREGAFDEAQVLLQDALVQIDKTNLQTRALVLLRKALVERSAKRFNDALRTYDEAVPLFELSANHLLQGKFHNGLANVLNHLSVVESRKDYVDRALIEYAAASFHFDQASHARYEGCVENNLGFLFSTLGKFSEAHQHLDRAQMLYTRLKDHHVAQIDETRARVLLAEGRVIEAEKTARTAVRTLEQGDEQSLLAEALTTHGIALARLKHPEQSRATLERALEVAERAGDLESAGNAAMVLIEELGSSLANDDLTALVDRARELLINTQDLSTLRRLTACTGRVLALVHASPRFPATVDWNVFSFKQSVREYEAHFIGLALDDTGGVVSHAARLLGFNHHQSLLALLNGRHEVLRHRSVPIVPRRRSIIRSQDANGSHPKKKRGKNKTRILHVEDNPAVAQVVREKLELTGCEVETCADGTAALEKIASKTHYDLLLLDNELPGMSGLALAQHARGLAHHHQTPIIILSAMLDDQTARGAGVNAFLRKPEDISAVGETVTKLLKAAR